MDHLVAMRLFVRIVELKSFSRAAEKLELPRGSATQIIKQLEALDLRYPDPEPGIKGLVIV